MLLLVYYFIVFVHNILIYTYIALHAEEIRSFFWCNVQEDIRIHILALAAAAAAGR